MRCHWISRFIGTFRSMAPFPGCIGRWRLSFLLPSHPFRHRRPVSEISFLPLTLLRFLRMLHRWPAAPAPWSDLPTAGSHREQRWRRWLHQRWRNRRRCRRPLATLVLYPVRISETKATAIIRQMTASLFLCLALSVCLFIFIRLSVCLSVCFYLSLAVSVSSGLCLRLSVSVVARYSVFKRTGLSGILALCPV